MDYAKEIKALNKERRIRAAIKRIVSPMTWIVRTFGVRR